MEFKSGVIMEGVKPIIFQALDLVEKCFTNRDYIMVITSGKDGTHIKNSLHYSGLAVDIRIRHINSVFLVPIINSMRDVLGRNFDVVLESDHIHLEYDPK